jgi:hypothetical protein
MKQILLLILTFTFTNIFAQVTDTTFISADNQGKLYRTTVTVDQVTGKKITTDDPITDTTEQLNIYRAAYTQEITRRMNDYNVVYDYKRQIGQVIKAAMAIEDQFNVYMIDTTGIQEFVGKTFDLKNVTNQTKISFRLTQGTTNAQGKITSLPKLQWSFTKAAGTWKRAFYAPGYLRLVDFDASNNTEFFLDNNSKVKSYITLGDEYKIILN